MLVLLLIPILAEAGYPQKQNQGKARRPKSFTFMTNQNKEFTLKKDSLKTRDNFLHRLSKRIRGSEKEYEGWYYLHVLEDNFAEVLKVVPLSTENAILRDTFIAYLTEEQVYKLENITLFKQLSSEDKFTEDGGSIENTNYFHVITKRGISIPENTELYKIESQSDDDTYVIFVDPKGLNQKEIHNKKKKAVEYLSSLRFVKSVSTFTRPTIKNAVFTGYTQQNKGPGYIQKDSNGLLYLPRYVNLKGYNGEGQIITIQDTPIDFNHAMFRDDSTEVVFNKYMSNHRKFVYYGTKSSSPSDWVSKLETNEHGTHVAGTTAGKSIGCTNNAGADLFNGNAPDAKILYAGDLNDVSATQLGKFMSDYKSYISTNSWGVNGYNDQINNEYSKLAYNNPERLFLFAAGNEYSDGNFTVCDPGGSKNVLTVGSMGDFFQSPHHYQINGQIDAIALLDADPWTYGMLGTTSSADIVAIDPSKGNQCNLINSGKISLLYTDNPNELEWIYSCQLESTSGILYARDAAAVSYLINTRVSCVDVTKINASQGITHADYSSGGPGNKGILKPDIMTPGTRIISAKSRANYGGKHGCETTGGGDFTYMQGTSMATPNAAGATALVREYFKRNWNVDLDGTTLRALMINSCKHPHNSKTPDVLFGHGIVDLSTILPFDNSFGVQMTYSHPISNGRSTKASNKPRVGENSYVYATVQVTANTKPLQITLSYLDKVANANSPIPIINDLDLFVVDPNEKMYKGDHLSNNDAQHFSTNEKVIIDSPTPGTYTIYVFGGNFDETVDEEQEFAVVVTGNIENKYLEFLQPNRCLCAQCDYTNPLMCACSGPYIGSVCHIKITDITGNTAQTNLEALQMDRIYLRWDREIKSVIVKSSGGGKGSTVWANPTCEVSPSQYAVNGGTSSFFSKGVNTNFGTNEICVAIFNNNYQRATYSIELSDKENGGGFGKTNTIVTAVCVIAGVAAIALVVYCCCCRKRGGTAVEDEGGGVSQQSI